MFFFVKLPNNQFTKYHMLALLWLMRVICWWCKHCKAPVHLLVKQNHKKVIFVIMPLLIFLTASVMPLLNDSMHFLFAPEKKKRSLSNCYTRKNVWVAVKFDFAFAQKKMFGTYSLQTLKKSAHLNSGWINLFQFWCFFSIFR